MFITLVFWVISISVVFKSVVNLQSIEMHLYALDLLIADATILAI